MKQLLILTEIVVAREPICTLLLPDCSIARHCMCSSELANRSATIPTPLDPPVCKSYIPILEVYGELLNESRKEKTKKTEGQHKQGQKKWKEEEEGEKIQRKVKKWTR